MITRPFVSTTRCIAGLCALLLLGFSVGANAEDSLSASLPKPVAQALARYHMSAHGLSIVVRPAASGEAVLAYNADTPRSPASTMKLLTTLVALEDLGPAFTWKTEAYGTGPVRAGHLEGDLYIKGYGDPDLVIEDFWRFLHGLRDLGIKQIDGNLVLDQSYFAPVTGTPADFDDQPLRAYNVLPGALLVNFQAVRIRFFPEPDARRVRVVADPLPDGLDIVNHLHLTSGECHGWAQDIAMRLTRAGQRKRAIFTGRYPAACGDHDLYRALSGPLNYTGGIFRELWAGMGGSFSGSVLDGSVPATAQLLYTGHSPPLAEVIRNINKFSNNVMTRQLLLTLGADLQVPPGTIENGAKVVRDWLSRNNLLFPELVLDNGSGLSRNARISAHHLADLLVAAYDSPYMPEYFSSLPILAVDGTMKRRLEGSLLAGRAHLKSGSLNGVRSAAGIMLDAKGRRMVIVCLHNDPRADTPAGEAVQNALLEWVYSRP